MQMAKPGEMKREGRRPWSRSMAWVISTTTSGNSISDVPDQTCKVRNRLRWSLRGDLAWIHRNAVHSRRHRFHFPLVLQEQVPLGTSSCGRSSKKAQRSRTVATPRFFSHSNSNLGNWLNSVTDKLEVWRPRTEGSAEHRFCRKELQSAHDRYHDCVGDWTKPVSSSPEFPWTSISKREVGMDQERSKGNRSRSLRRSGSLHHFDSALLS